MPAHVAEFAPEQNLAVRLHRHASDGGVRIGIEVRVERAIGMHPRDVAPRDPAHGGYLAPEQNLAVRLHRHAMDVAVRIGIEVRVERAVGIQPREADAVDPAHLLEFAPDQNLAVRLHRHAMDEAVHIGIEARVEHAVGVALAVGIEPGDVVATGPERVIEFAREQNLAVRLQRHAFDFASSVARNDSIQISHEVHVERAVGIDPGDAF